MEHFSNENLQIYRKVNNCIESGYVIPFEDKLVLFLASHTDSKNKEIKNYLDALNSEYSIGKGFMFARYLALGINEPFHLYEGKLKNLYNGEFTHAWIETKDYVYDVTFAGKWPKKLYYQLFQPVVEDDVNLESDEDYIKYKNRTVETTPTNNYPALQYINWYTYMRRASSPNPFNIPLNPKWYYFPQDLERINEEKFIQFIQEEWNKQKTNDNDEIPEELFSVELREYVKTKTYIKEKTNIYIELIKFITTNRREYEEKKDILYDISLWRIAIREKYSGEFSLLISDIPKIIAKSKEKENEAILKK